MRAFASCQEGVQDPQWATFSPYLPNLASGTQVGPRAAVEPVSCFNCYSEKETGNPTSQSKLILLVEIWDLEFGISESCIFVLKLCFKLSLSASLKLSSICSLLVDGNTQSPHWSKMTKASPRCFVHYLKDPQKMHTVLLSMCA